MKSILIHVLIIVLIALSYKSAIGMEIPYKERYANATAGAGVGFIPSTSSSSSEESESSEEPDIKIKRNPILTSQFEPEIIASATQPEEEIDWAQIPKALYDNPTALKKFRAQQAARQKIVSSSAQQPTKKTGLFAWLPNWVYNWWYNKQ